jgi:guanine deaminase
VEGGTAVGLAGHVIDAPTFGALRSSPDGAVVIEGGRIVAVGVATELKRAWSHVEWRSCGSKARPIIVPGLIDVHAHVPQYPAVARVERSLLPWLQRHIFPLEKNFRAGRDRLGDELDAFFGDLAAHGTTTAMLYAAVWGDSCDLAFEAADRSGLRVIMGKVMMDVGSYGVGETASADEARRHSLAETAELIRTWHGRDGGRIEYAVSPRFAVTCSMELMEAAARLAAEHDCAVQTHLSENHDEIRTVAALFPEASSYTDVYRRARLLTPRAVLGHCLHQNADEIAMMAEARSAVAHCPTSNLFLNSGFCPLDRLRAAGLRIGLGSDIAAGPELNLWQIMRSAIETQKARRFVDASVPELTPAEAFFLATTGGAAALGKTETIGIIEPGFDADLLVLDLNKVLPYGGKFGMHAEPLGGEDVIALCVYRANADAVIEARVRGRIVAGPRDARS